MPITKEQAAAIQVKLKEISDRIEQHVEDISKLFPPGFRVTVISRNPQAIDATMVSTQEPDLRDVIPTIEHLIERRGKRRGK